MYAVMLVSQAFYDGRLSCGTYSKKSSLITKSKERLLCVSYQFRYL